MSTILNFTNEGTDYKLEYTRGTAKKISQMGLRITRMEDDIIGQRELLFHGAFLKNHPNLKRKVTDKLFYDIESEESQASLVEMLVEMFSECATTLNEKGNATWQVVEKSKK